MRTSGVRAGWGVLAAAGCVAFAGQAQAIDIPEVGDETLTIDISNTTELRYHWDNRNDAPVDPASPTLVSSLSTPGSCRDVEVVGDYAYLVSQPFGEPSGLLVIDISNPGYPGQVGFCETAGKSEGLAIAGQYVYIANGLAGLQIIDVTDPAHPQSAGQLDTPGYAMDVVITGTDYVSPQLFG